MLDILRKFICMYLYLLTHLAILFPEVQSHSATDFHYKFGRNVGEEKNNPNYWHYI